MKRSRVDILGMIGMIAFTSVFLGAVIPKVRGAANWISESWAGPDLTGRMVIGWTFVTILGFIAFFLLKKRAPE